MNPIAECAAQTLLHHPHPALRLSELLQLVAERVDRGLDPGRLRTLLEEHPETFRLLDPWSGPWRDHDGPRAPGTLWTPGSYVYRSVSGRCSHRRRSTAERECSLDRAWNRPDVAIRHQPLVRDRLG